AAATRRVRGLTSNVLFPALLLSADLAAVAAIIYVSTPPIASNRFLLLALMSVSLAAFYFGSGLGVYATLLSAVMYALISEVLPPFVAGPRPYSAITNVVLFTL